MFFHLGQLCPAGNCTEGGCKWVSMDEFVCICGENREYNKETKLCQGK